MSTFLLELSYLIGSITFIVGLKRLSSPDTARNGNLLAAFGMGLAILTTIFFHQNERGEFIGNIGWIVAAIGLGSVLGYLAAMRVKMTAMPQMVSLFNGMGGACAALISVIEFGGHEGETTWGFRLIVYLGMVIGAVSFAGSMVAYGKLDEKIKDLGGRYLTYFNLLLLLLI
ncbi:MAG TPA: NAD(P)(+) transhydrogenase (Re/Si-specific) subunit beta, partial [Saprospiraceae bacterium]|nr:NAD(P)(+) transhydrogenase (Re/Si-specific) subunit beta [Saprospiraceae bacterium]